MSLPTLKLITDYLQNQKQRTKVGSIYSDLEDISLGVPQGSILGPLFYLISFYVTYFLKMKIIIIQITLMAPRHTLLIALQQKH